jgi:pilus assembly protein CpaE
METGNVAFAMKAHTDYSILDACRNINRLDTHFWKGLISNGQPNLSILTAPGDLRGLEPPLGVEVRQVLRFARSVYDFTIVDLASSLSRLTLAALEEVDRAFLITTTELPSLHMAKRALQSLGQVGYATGRVDLVLNRISRRDEVTPADIERNLGVPVFWSFPEDHVSTNEFYVKGGLISAKSGLGKSIRQFVEKIPGVKPEAAEKKQSFLGL